MIKQSLKLAFRPAIVVVMVMVLATGTVFAAINLLGAGDVAEQLGNPSLSAAFEGESAVEINASQTAGGYTFTLMSMVSGSDISDQRVTRNGEVLSDRTYAVIAIQKADGSPMADFDDPAADDERFFISPYVKGYAPQELNSYMLSGGGSMTIIDGVLYVLTDVDNITMFADRGVYIGISSGVFFFGEAFIFDEGTGEMAPNPAFDGVSVLFDLPLDISLADPEKAEQYMAGLLGADGEDGEGASEGAYDEYGDYQREVVVEVDDGNSGYWLEVARD
ncbi:MAG: hypothetical protein FWH32_07615 [Clostridiales bacterium]|nr:hypothetical protein [Clostridiales bacterium]